MNRRLLSVLSLTLGLLLSVPALQPAFAQLGVAAGLNFNQLSDIETDSRDVTLDNATGWHVELWFDLPLGPIALRPGVRYMDAGSIYDGLREDIGSVDGEDFDVSLIEVPIDLRFRMGIPIISPYVALGPVLRFPAGASERIEDNLNDFSVGGSAGLGLEIGLGGLRLYPEIKYSFGISNFTDGFEIGDVEFMADEGQRLNNVLLRLGIGFK